jgi:hypothetical protein
MLLSLPFNYLLFNPLSTIVNPSPEVLQGILQKGRFIRLMGGPLKNTALKATLNPNLLRVF